MHGPFLFHANALVYLLFGDSDATSRFLPALAGVMLVGAPWLLRGQRLPRPLGGARRRLHAVDLSVVPLLHAIHPARSIHVHRGHRPRHRDIPVPREPAAAVDDPRLLLRGIHAHQSRNRVRDRPGLCAGPGGHAPDRFASPARARGTRHRRRRDSCSCGSPHRQLGTVPGHTLGESHHRPAKRVLPGPAHQSVCPRCPADRRALHCWLHLGDPYRVPARPGGRRIPGGNLWR